LEVNKNLKCRAEIQHFVLLAVAVTVLWFVFTVFSGGSNHANTAGASDTVVGWVQNALSKIFQWR